jgi:hypothetical protein
VKNYQKNKYDSIFSPENIEWHPMVLQNKNTSPTTLSKKLINYYLVTWYQVKIEPYRIVTLHIGNPSESVATLMQTTKTQNATYITAYNPASHIATFEENQSATTQLYEQLTSHSKHIYRGESIDPTGKWPAETSFLALGVDLISATTIGRLFAQNAIVWLNIDAIPKLVLLR